MKIAVLEDEHDWRSNIAFLLETDGHSVETFESFEGKDPSAFLHYDMVISDNLFVGTERTGSEFLIGLRHSGFLGKLLLYSNSPDEGRPASFAASNNIVVATKDQHIDLVVDALK